MERPRTARPSATPACYQALPLLLWPLTASLLTCLASGVVLARHPPRLLRYWWVAIKLVLNIVQIVVLRPGLQEASEHGRQYEAAHLLATIAHFDVQRYTLAGSYTYRSGVVLLTYVQT